MNSDKLTQKTIETINAATAMARENDNQYVTPEHLLYAMLDQDGGLIPTLLGRMGADCDAMLSALDTAIGKLPKVQGAQSVYPSNEFGKVVDFAEKIAQKLKDEYVSVEHLMLGIFAHETPAIKQILREHNITRDGFTAELAKVKTGHVTSDNPEDTYDALEKYGTDLVARARDNELDPVIGRDLEIRNVIRILSRKTKNNPVLIGDPGVGKSSLTLRTCAEVARQGRKVLYVTGEESTRQVRMRADRLGALAESLYVVAETNLSTIETHVQKVEPELLVIDSIQTVFKPEVQSAPGSVSQVRECSVELLRIAKGQGIAAFIIGHVTKEGNLAGPRVLEHIVDTVLYFEGERNAEYRVLRAVKNRFGSTNELGIFEMREVGLADVPDASKLFLSDRQQDSGTVIIPTVEGTRPLLVEVQALVAPTPYVPPRRTADSVDIKRIQLLLAVLEKRVHLSIGACDVYVKVAGGIRIDEPAADLGLCVAMASSFANRLPRPKTIVFGEVGLSGEVRAVSQAEARVSEAKRLGFEHVILPAKNCRQLQGEIRGISLYGAESIGEALKLAMPK